MAGTGGKGPQLVAKISKDGPVFDAAPAHFSGSGARGRNLPRITLLPTFHCHHRTPPPPLLRSISSWSGRVVLMLENSRRVGRSEKEGDFDHHAKLFQQETGSITIGVITPNQIPLTTIVTYLQKRYRSRISNHWVTISACNVVPPIYKQIRKHTVTYHFSDYQEFYSDNRQIHTKCQLQCLHPPQISTRGKCHCAIIHQTTKATEYIEWMSKYLHKSPLSHI